MLSSWNGFKVAELARGPDAVCPKCCHFGYCLFVAVTVLRNSQEGRNAVRPKCCHFGYYLFVAVTV